MQRTHSVYHPDSVETLSRKLKYFFYKIVMTDLLDLLFKQTLYLNYLLTTLKMTLRRTSSQEPLYSIVSEEFFTARGTGETPDDANTMYRIPAHQRFPSWPLAKKQKLVDSVLRNYPIHAIIAIRQLKNNGLDVVEYCDIEDGQTRMTALQEYLIDGFACDIDGIGAGRLFSELPQAMQQSFRNYQVTLEVFSGRQITHDEIAEIFNRLNSGKPLGDNDKYHSRLTTSVLSSLTYIKTHPELRDDFNKFIGPIGSGKTRKGLSDMVGAILAVGMNQTARITTSYEQNYRYLGEVFSADQTATIIAFFKAYFVMLHLSVDGVTARHKKCYGKLSGVLGLAICAWIRNGEGYIPTAIGWYVSKTLHNPKYVPATFSELNKGDLRNCQGDSVARRLTKVCEQFELDEADELPENVYDEQDADDEVSTISDTSSEDGEY